MGILPFSITTNSGVHGMAVGTKLKIQTDRTGRLWMMDKAMTGHGKHVKWTVLAGILLLILLQAFPVRAAEQEKQDGSVGETVTGTLQQTIKAAEIKEEPDVDSDTLTRLKKGTAVIVYGEPQDSWSKVEYQGTPGYMESSRLEMYSVEATEEQGQEFQIVEEEMIRTVDEYELIQKEKRNSRIWGTVIVILVMAIFVVGIVSALRQYQEGEK